MKKSFPGVSRMVDRHGKVRWRFRVKGLPQRYIPGPFGSEAFIAALEAARNPVRTSAAEGRCVPGTISSMIAGYYSSADFSMLGIETQKVYRRILEKLREKNGDKPVSQITGQAILHKLDEMRDRPGAANQFLKTLRSLTRYAVARRILKVDPTFGIRKRRYKSDGFHTWTDGELATFEAFYPLGTKARLAYELLINTAQRRSDVVLLGPQHEIENRTKLKLRQRKTGEWLALPMLPELREAIAACPQTGGTTYLVTEYGKPFSVAGFGNWFSERCSEAGLQGCSAHGLRKAAATRLANQGATTHEIMSITGHRSVSEVERYTRAANQERLAEGAIVKLARKRA